MRDKLCEIILFSTMNIVAELHNYNYCLQLFLTWKIMVWQQLYPCSGKHPANFSHLFFLQTVAKRICFTNYCKLLSYMCKKIRKQRNSITVSQSKLLKQYNTIDNKFMNMSQIAIFNVNLQSSE